MISHILCVQNFANQGQLSRLKVLQSDEKKWSATTVLFLKCFHYSVGRFWTVPFVGKKYQYQNTYLSYSCNLFLRVIFDFDDMLFWRE